MLFILYNTYFFVSLRQHFIEAIAIVFAMHLEQNAG